MDETVILMIDVFVVQCEVHSVKRVVRLTTTLLNIIHRSSLYVGYHHIIAIDRHCPLDSLEEVRGEEERAKKGEKRGKSKRKGVQGPGLVQARIRQAKLYLVVMIGTAVNCFISSINLVNERRSDVPKEVPSIVLRYLILLTLYLSSFSCYCKLRPILRVHDAHIAKPQSCECHHRKLQFDKKSLIYRQHDRLCQKDSNYTHHS